MKDGDKLITELKQRAERVRKIRGLIQALLLPRYEPPKQEYVEYYQENKN